MAKNIRRNFASPTNSCLNQKSTNTDLYVGPECERNIDGNIIPKVDDGYCPECKDGYDGYVFIQEGSTTTDTTLSPTTQVCDNLDVGGYHRYTAADVFRGYTQDGKCSSPYSRGVLKGGNYNTVIRNREEQLLQATGKPVVLLRRQYTGPECVCRDINRGRGKASCHVCFGTGYTPGYIPFINQKDPLGRIKVRFDPYKEDNPLKEQGIFQEVNINAWTLSTPIVRKRDIIIVYNPDGTEEFRYEILNVTRNDLFGIEQGAQKFEIKRIDPTNIIYSFDPFRIPDLADISIDISDNNPQSPTMYEQLGTQDEQDGNYTNNYTEGRYGDAAFSGMITEGYKLGYETNYKRALEYKIPLNIPDFNEDGVLNDGFGTVFYSSTGKVIKFSTPQQIQDNIGINPLEVIAAEKKRFFTDGWVEGAKAGYQDGLNELRARGLI